MSAQRLTCDLWNRTNSMHVYYMKNEISDSRQINQLQTIYDHGKVQTTKWKPLPLHTILEVMQGMQNLSTIRLSPLKLATVCPVQLKNVLRFFKTFTLRWPAHGAQNCGTLHTHTWNAASAVLLPDLSYCTFLVHTSVSGYTNIRIQLPNSKAQDLFLKCWNLAAGHQSHNIYWWGEFHCRVHKHRLWTQHV